MTATRFTFYCHTNRVNGKRYVGQTLSTMEKRWTEHVSAARRHKGALLFGSAIRKYGPDAFMHEVLEEIVTTQEDADIREAKWITAKNSLPPNGYNIAEGGGSVGMSGLVKERIATMSPDQRAEFFKKTIHKPENWTPERFARQLKALQSEKACENRRKAGPLRSEKMREFQRARQATLTAEQKSEIAKKAWKTRRANFSEAEISQMGRIITARRWSGMSQEARAELSRKMSEGRNKMSAEAASEKARKAWVTRVKKYGPKGHGLDAELVPFVRHWRKRGHSVESIALAFDVSTGEIERAVA